MHCWCWQFNRDRFVLSNGHACALQYVMLHLTGYDLSIDDLKSFRQMHSKCVQLRRWCCAFDCVSLHTILYTCAPCMEKRTLVWAGELHVVA